jgi:Tol biopolymer transport system component
MTLSRVALVLLLTLTACSGGSSPGADQSPQQPSGTIAFMRGGQHHPYDVFVMNADGSDVRNLTHSPEFEDTYPSISPDRARIAFAGDYTGSFDLNVMFADGSGRSNITNDDIDEGSLAWSPDGGRIAYASSGGDIFVIDSDGTNRRQLTSGPAQDDFPAWNPNGSLVLFSSDRGGGGTFAVDLSGGRPKPVAADRGAFSPDGKRLALLRGLTPPGRLAIADPDGSHATPLFPGERHDWFVVWSPDGTYLAVTNDRDGNLDIFTVDTGGSGLRQLTRSKLDDVATSWR